MPLLDGALAFALTMLALSSLVSWLQEGIHQWKGERRRNLKEMVRRFAEALPSDTARAEAGKKPTTEAAASDSETEDESQCPPAVLAQGLAGLWQAIDDHGWTELSENRLLGAVGRSRRGPSPTASPTASPGPDTLDPAQVKAPRQETTVLRREVLDVWQPLEDEFTRRFRNKAKWSATLLATVIAFALNIDSLFLLESFLNDGRAPAAIADLGPAYQAHPADAPYSFEQSLALLRSPALAIGWDHFPNCPPISMDRRCLQYWSTLSAPGDIRQLSSDQRIAGNPTRHPFRALGLVGRSLNQANAVAVHTSTDGGPATDGGAVGHDVPSGRLSIWSVLAWILGCSLTGILAGQGSPFWFEVVQRLSVIRDEWRQKRLNSTSARPSKPLPGKT